MPQGWGSPGLTDPCRGPAPALAGRRQLEIPAEGQRGERLLPSPALRGSGSGSCRPRGVGAVGWLGRGPARPSGPATPLAPERASPGSRPTWAGPSVRWLPSPSMACRGLTSSGAGRTRCGAAGGARRLPREPSWGWAAPAPSGPGDGGRLALPAAPPEPSRVAGAGTTSGRAEAAGTASPVCGGSGSSMAHAAARGAARSCGDRRGHPEGIRAAAAAGARAALPPGGDGGGGSIPAPGEAPSPPGSAGSAGGRLPVRVRVRARVCARVSARVRVSHPARTRAPLPRPTKAARCPQPRRPPAPPPAPCTAEARAP